MLESFDLILRIESSPLASQGYIYAVDAALTAQDCELKAAVVLGPRCLKILSALPSDHQALKRLRQLELMEIPLLAASLAGAAPGRSTGTDPGTRDGPAQSAAGMIQGFPSQPKLNVRFLNEEELIALCRRVKELSF